MEDIVYLLSVSPHLTRHKAGEVIRFEMPPFCSGEYTAVIKEDEHGAYINREDNFFQGCRGYEVYSAEEGAKYLDNGD